MLNIAGKIQLSFPKKLPRTNFIQCNVVIKTESVLIKYINNNNSKSILKILKCDVRTFTERSFSKHVKYGE